MLTAALAAGEPPVPGRAQRGRRTASGHTAASRRLFKPRAMRESQQAQCQERRASDERAGGDPPPFPG